MLGALGEVYMRPGQWQISISYRSQQADEVFTGSQESAPRGALKRSDYFLELDTTYAFSKQCNLTLGIPFSQQTFSRRTPFPNGPYDATHSYGLDDITLTARFWLLAAASHPNGNISLGLGLKFPTGNDDVMGVYRNAAGTNPQLKPVSSSIQPGQGGLGVITEVQAFRTTGDLTLFGSGFYLFNPRNTNDTLSLAVGLNGFDATPPNARYNSVPDLYAARVGAAVAVHRVAGLALSLAGRIEGSPRHDIIGRSEGFRIAGYGVFIEPGISWSHGPDVWAVSVPVRVDQYQLVAPGSPRETFANHILLITFSSRFGGR